MPSRPRRRSAPPHLWLSASSNDCEPKPAASAPLPRAPRYEQLCWLTGSETQSEEFADVSQPNLGGAAPRLEQPGLQDGVTRAGSSFSTTASGPAGPGFAPLSRASPDSTTDLANSRASDSPSVPLPSSNSIPRGAAASTGPQPSPLVLSHDRSTAQKLAYGLRTPQRDRQSPNRRPSVQERPPQPPLLLHVGMVCAPPTLPSPPKSGPPRSLTALDLPPPIDGFYRLSVSPSRAARGGSSADVDDDDDVTTLSFPLPPNARARARLAALESAPEVGSPEVSSSRSQHAPSPSAPSVPIPDFVPVLSHHHDRSRSEELAGLSTRRDDPAIFASARDSTVPSSWSRCSRRTELPPPTSMAASYPKRSSSRPRTHETPLAESTASTSQQVSAPAPSTSVETTMSSASSSPPRNCVRSVSWARNVAPGWSLRAEQLAWAEARRQSRRRPPLIVDSKEGGFARERGAFRTRIVGAVFVVIVLAVVILLVVGLAIALTR
ncbi:hypothetical protein C6P46_003909 [Rhodotorula mucilaginosa]|jgi:hypothetical protein|uniref:Uncharacterized protein n=1 Tax=Rhodotorula mucilaginosa TaxID=5537 RepID=A0A9P6W3G9_RHOMI|nr:hypothetical protein C6P46_003909 [Rhodotorula mucilaginosa]